MRLTTLVGALLAGAGMMFLLDPDRGARRRALVRDQASSARRRMRERVRATVEDAGNRASGTLAEMRQRWRDEPVSDAVLVERVRARIGLVCAGPGAIEVEAHDGCVTLRGAAGRDEIGRVVRAAKWTRGVRMVDDQLTARDEAAGG